MYLFFDSTEGEKLKGIVDKLQAVLSKRCDQEGKLKKLHYLSTKARQKFASKDCRIPSPGYLLFVLFFYCKIQI